MTKVPENLVSLALNTPKVSSVVVCADQKSVLMITHYKRLLEHVKPDHIHVLYDGKIVKSGDYDLANFLEKEGYDWIKKT